MAVTDRNTIKTWFETGDYPTEQQFWNWLDSFWHQADQIPTANIIGLDTILTDKATVEETNSLQTQIDNINLGNAPISNIYTVNSSFLIPDGKILEKIVVIGGTSTNNFGIGQTNGGYEVMTGVPIGINDAQLFELNIYSNGGKTIWFNGITGSTTIKIYLR